MRRKLTKAINITPIIIGLIFIGLKLGGVLPLSWFWVLSPFWIYFAVILFMCMFTVISVLLALSICPKLKGNIDKALEEEAEESKPEEPTVEEKEIVPEIVPEEAPVVQETPKKKRTYKKKKKVKEEESTDGKKETRRDLN